MSGHALPRTRRKRRRRKRPRGWEWATLFMFALGCVLAPIVWARGASLVGVVEAFATVGWWLGGRGWRGAGEILYDWLVGRDRG